MDVAVLIEVEVALEIVHEKVFAELELFLNEVIVFDKVR